MVKDPYIYLNHIKKSINKIVIYTKDIDEETFYKNDIIQDAVIRQFEIIGEATKRINIEFRSKYPKIPWKDMAGMRDILIHEYLNVDIGILWETIKKDIPKLKKLLENIS
ncbi:MAG: DUF86 domain-containing protein [Ignavibacteria bacterium]